MNVLDCRGLPCPEPVIRCRDWLATVNGAVLEVLVDNPAAVENVSVFLSGRGLTVDSRREGDAVWRLSAVRDLSLIHISCRRSDDATRGRRRRRSSSDCASRTTGLDKRGRCVPPRRYLSLIHI